MLACPESVLSSLHRIVPPILHPVKPVHRLRNFHHKSLTWEAIAAVLTLCAPAFDFSHQLNPIEQVIERANDATDMSARGVDVHECLFDLPVRLTGLKDGFGAGTKDEDVVDSGEQRILASRCFRNPELLVSRSALGVVGVLSYF